MDIYKVNLSVLKSYKNDFDSEYKNFTNNTYSTFSSSYLKNCNDYYVKKIVGELKIQYNAIKNGYININKWWSDYNSNIEGLENFLSDNGGPGAISEASVRCSALGLPIVNNSLDAFDDFVSMTLPDYIQCDFAMSKDLTGYIDSSFNFLYSDYYKDVDPLNNIYGEVCSTISNDVDCFFGDIIDCFIGLKEWIIADVSPFISNLFLEILDVCKKTCATVALFNMSLTEGVLSVGEKLIDLVAILGAACNTLVTVTVDFAYEILGLFTGEEYESFTKQLWEETKAFVEKKYVSSMYNTIYEDGFIGQWIYENSFASDVVRNVGSTIGYATGVVLLIVASGGTAGVAAGGAAGGTSVAASGATLASSVSTFFSSVKGALAAYKAAKGTITVTQYAFAYGLLGFSKNTENAWADDANILEGLSVGAILGLFEAALVYLNKSDIFNVGNAKKAFNAVKKASGLDAALSNGDVFVPLFTSMIQQDILSAVQGGTKEIVSVGIQALYKDGYYNNNGEFVEFTSNESLVDKYYELFAANGGWKTVFTKAAVTGHASTIVNWFDFFSDTSVSVGKSFEVTGDIVSEYFDSKSSMYTTN